MFNFSYEGSNYDRAKRELNLLINVALNKGVKAVKNQTIAAMEYKEEAND